MKAIIKFDKYNKNVTRKSIIEIELNEKNGKEVFTVSASMRGRAGQCLDEIIKYNRTPLFKEIYRLWKNYHLNDMHAGTEKQEKAVEIFRKNNHNKRYDYNSICEYLKEINLYEDNGYKYGKSWLYREIPEKDLKIIKEIIEYCSPSNRYEPFTF